MPSVRQFVATLRAVVPAVLGIVALHAIPIPAWAEVPIRSAARIPGDRAPADVRMVRLPQTNSTVPSGRRRFADVRASATSQPANMPIGGQLAEPIDRGSLEPKSTTTLADVEAIALANSPQIREAENQAVAARARQFQASMYPNPTFGTAAPQLAGNQSQYNAYVIQDVVTRGKIGLDTAAAARAAREAELAVIRARFDVLTAVRQRFYTALVAQERVKVLENMAEIARTSLGISERLFKAETGTRGDVLLLRIEASRVEAELKNAATLADTTKRQLAAATGVFTLPIVAVEGDLRQSLPNYDLTAVQQGVLARNALARSAEVEIGRNQFVLRRAQVEPFPNVNMMGGYQNQLPGALAPQSQAIYQIQMVVPLWNRNQGNIRAAQAGVSTAVAQLNRVQTELANAAAATLGRYLTAQHLVERYEMTVLPAANELQDISGQLYAQGQIEFLQYLNSQRALLNANLEYIAALEEQWSAAAEVAGLLQSERFP